MLINLGKAPPKIWIPINVNHVIFISLLALAASTSTRMQMRLHHTWKLLHGCKSELPEHRGKLKAQCSRHLWAMSCACSRISCLTRKMFDVGASANKGKVIDYQRMQKDSISKSYIIEGSLEVKLPTIWTDEKQSRAEAERRERLEERRWEKRKSQKKEDADARKGRKVAKHCVFPMICGSGGSKSRLAKAAGAEPAGQMRHEKVHAVVARSTFRSQNVQNITKHTRFGPLLEVEMSKKCTPLWREAHFQVKITPLWREAHFQVKMYKTHHCRTTFGSCDVEKVHAIVARSTFRSENVQNTTFSRRFWKLRCRKSARRCGAKHISKWKCTKHHIFAPLLEVKMSKKCTPLWREAHFEVKMYKTLHVRATFGGSDVEKVHAVVARSTFQKWKCTKH